MAGEEEVELRDLVAQTLETKGVLGKIRAQLRANVFLALEEQESQQRRHPFLNEKLEHYLKTKEGQLAVGLVREFLQFFELDFTCAVFDPETNALETYAGREQLASDLSLDASSSSSQPLLASLLQRSRHPPQLTPLGQRHPFPDSAPAATHASVPPRATTSNTATAERTGLTLSGSPSLPSDLLSGVAPPPTSSLGPLATVSSSTSSSANSKVDTPTLTSLTSMIGTGATESSKSKSAPHVFGGKSNGTDHFSARPPPPNEPLVSLGQSMDLASLHVHGPSGTGGVRGGGGALAELDGSLSNSSLNMEKLLNFTADVSCLMKQGGGGRIGDPEKDELDDFFNSTPVPNALGDKGISRGFKGQRGGGHGDSFLSDGEATVSEHLEDTSQPPPSYASGRLETTDISLSQNSISGDFDHMEHVQT